MAELESVNGQKLDNRVADYIKNLESGAETKQDTESSPEVKNEVETLEETVITADTATEGANEDTEEMKAGESESEDKLLESIANVKAIDDESESLPKNVQKKINRETAARKQAEEEAAKLREQLLVMQSGANVVSPHSPVNTASVIDESLPVSEQVRLAIEAEKNAEKQKAEIKRQADYIQHLQDLATQKAEQASRMFDDYEEVTLPAAQRLTPQLAMALPHCENMGKIMYYLGKNPAYLDNLLAIKNPTELAMTLGKLDQRLSKKPETKKVSSAPKPSEKVGSSAGHGSKAADVTQMKQSDFKKAFKSGHFK